MKFYPPSLCFSLPRTLSISLDLGPQPHKSVGLIIQPGLVLLTSLALCFYLVQLSLNLITAVLSLSFVMIITIIFLLQYSQCKYL